MKAVDKLSENILDKLSIDFLRSQVLKNAYGNNDTVIAAMEDVYKRQCSVRTMMVPLSPLYSRIRSTQRQTGGIFKNKSFYFISPAAGLSTIPLSNPCKIHAKFLRCADGA